MKISEQIKKAREKAGLTQSELAEKIGLSGHNIISYFENGDRTPSLDTLYRIADALHYQFTISGKKVNREWNEIIR